jgi:hypothetical protein
MRANKSKKPEKEPSLTAHAISFHLAEVAALPFICRLESSRACSIENQSWRKSIVTSHEVGHIREG